MSSIFKSQPTWADVCLGYSASWPSYAGLSPLSVKLDGAMARPGGAEQDHPQLWLRPEQAQHIQIDDSVIRLGSACKQRVQDERETTVFGPMIEDTSVLAPATAHVGVTANGGELGPYPWRRPV